jgi:ferredoxin-NADP reductase
VKETERLSEDVLRVRFTRPEGFDFLAGQYACFHGPRGLIRSYSLASLPGEKDRLEIHVRRVPQGEMSGWFFDDCPPGTLLRLTSARGDCCYVPGEEDLPYLLVGIGTGVAPLQAIAREAIARGKHAPLHFFQAGLNPERLYLRRELRALSLNYQEVVLNGPPGEWRVGHVADLVLEERKRIGTCQVFLCGDAATVLSLRKKLFLSGVPMARIKADAFVPAR